MQLRSLLRRLVVQQHQQPKKRHLSTLLRQLEVLDQAQVQHLPV